MIRPVPGALLLDMDGVLYHGEQVLPGAAALLVALADVPHAFITNNPIRSAEEVVDFLEGVGLPRPRPAQIVTSAAATAACLARERPGFRYFAVGAAGLHRALAEVGVADAERADYVVVGEGPGLDFEQLTIGINLVLKAGARLVSTNPDHSVDASVDGQHCVLPGGGALVAPFVVATGQAPLVIGKPQPLLYQMAMRRIGVSAGQCLMVGDRPDTDIVGAQRLGMWTALVRSGRFPVGADLPADVAPPDFDVADLPSLLVRFREAFPGLLSET